MIFPYQPRPIAPTKLVDGEVVWRPLVPLQVWGIPFEFVGVWALVDTGSDHTLLPYSLAKPLGVRLKTAPSTVQGFGGKSLSVFSGHVELRLADENQRYEWLTAVGFVRFGRASDEIAVLGHKGCLEYFRVTFDGERREVDLIPTSNFLGEVVGQH